MLTRRQFLATLAATLAAGPAALGREPAIQPLVDRHNATINEIQRLLAQMEDNVRLSCGIPLWISQDGVFQANPDGTVRNITQQFYKSLDERLPRHHRPAPHA